MPFQFERILHHPPPGQPLEEQYLDLLDLLEDLLNRADAGKNNIYLANFVAHVEAFLNHAEEIGVASKF